MKPSSAQRRLLGDIATWLRQPLVGDLIIGRAGTYTVHRREVEALRRAGFVRSAKTGRGGLIITAEGRRALKEPQP